MIIELINLLLISLAINIAMFIPAFILKTDKLTDISYSVTFILLTIYTFLQRDVSGVWDYLLLIMVTLWGIRLGGYLLKRVIKTGKDKRFDGIRENFSKFFAFWVIQGITVWIVLIPTLLFLSSDNTVANVVLATIGIMIWVQGFVIETVADIQKYRYINNRKEKGLERRWIDVGLWGISRHPNYLGEVTLWFGIYLLSITKLGLIPAMLAAVGPIYIYLIIRYFSGVPKLEEKDDERYKRNEEYLTYKKETGIIFPKI